MIQKLLRAIDAVCLWAAYVACFLLVLMAILGMIEIASRGLFNHSIPIAFEFSRYMLAMTMFLGSSWALRDGGHIRVTLLFEVLKPKSRRIVDFVATTFALGVSLYLSRAIIVFTATTYERGSRSFYPSETPLAWPQTALAIGIALISLALLARLIRIVINEPTESSKAGAGLEETSL
jgi:TRAP-type C4-dicarboxylate transport system permease small subunit